MNVDLRLIPSFVVLAEELHFGRAAKRLHIATPALSQQIKRLEMQLGTPLLSRSSRDVQLTDAGHALLVPAREALALLSTGIEASAQAAVRGSATRIGVPDVMPLIATWARALEQLGGSHRPEEFVVDSRPWPFHLADIEGHRLDIGMSVSTVGVRYPAGIAAWPVLRSARTGFIVARSHPFARSVNPRLRDLANTTVLILGRESHAAMYEWVSALMHAVEPNLSIPDGGVSMASAIQSATTGATAVLSIVDVGVHLPPGLTLVSADDLDLRLDVDVIWRHGELSSCGRGFLQALGLPDAVVGESYRSTAAGVISSDAPDAPVLLSATPTTGR